MIFPLYRVGPFRFKRGGPAFLSPRLVPAICDERALSYLMDDLLTQEEVSAEIQDLVGRALRVSGSDILYSDIPTAAVIENGELQELRYSFSADVQELGLTASIVPITGAGAMATSAAYTNFVY